MLKATDVANFFIDFSKSCEEKITNLKLNKLVYFAQAWSLVRLNKPLFDEPIEAWDYGPVIESVYNEFKKYGSGNINTTSGEYDVNKFSAEEYDLLIDVAIKYGGYAVGELVDMTHTEGSPWIQVYKEDERNIIEIEKIKKYFMDLKPLKQMTIPTSEDKFIGRHDKNGHLILPKDWDEDCES